MKNLICAVLTWLFIASQMFAQNSALQIRATGTGRTTGHIAILTIFNPGTTAQTLELPACFIPSSGGYQPYVASGIPKTTVPPGATANVPLKGYCADIFAPPVPSGASMPPVSNWLTSEQSPAAASLLDAILRISTTFDSLKNQTAITTPFSGNPEKEREAVIQQTFWIYSAQLSGRVYQKEHFRENTIQQFETATGQKFSTAASETQKNVEQGVTDFWNTFEAVGVEAKVLTNNQLSDVDYDSITKADDLPKPIRPAYDRYAAARALGSSHAQAMKDAFSSEDARDTWDARFKRIYNAEK